MAQTHNPFEDAEYEVIDRPTNADIPENRQLAPIQATPVSQAATDLAPFIQAAVAAGARDVKAMIATAKRVGGLLGRSAFYDFPAGGGRVTGPTIDLAYALSLEWGRCISRCMLVATDGRMVTLRGQYIDLVSMTIVERDARFSLSPPPGKFGQKPEQADRWRAMQEQAAISKAVRGAILGGLPTWLVDAALTEAHRVAASDLLKDKTIEQARALAIKYADDTFRLPAVVLEGWLGVDSALWTVGELDRLRVLFQDLKAGRVSAEGVRADAAKRTEPEPQPTGATDKLKAAVKAAETTKPAPKPSEGPTPEEQAEIAREEAEQARRDAQGGDDEGMA